jgi:RecA-family ATPase
MYDDTPEWIYTSGLRVRPTPPPPPAVVLPPPPKIGPRRVDAASWQDKPVPVREWLLAGMAPARNVTLLYGDGGIGKSLLALMLAAAVKAGINFFGHSVTRGNVEYISCEDELPEMQRRLGDIARSMGKPLSEFTGLHITSLADEDAILAAAKDGKGNLAVTALYAELETLLEQSRPVLLILDTLADVFGGNEIVRAQARQFVSMLRRLCLRYGCTIIVLAHPSVTGMQQGTSGSTAWSNSVRSRLYFHCVADDDDLDQDARILRVQKANYARVGSEIAMRWRDGVFVPDGLTVGCDQPTKDARADKVFLELLDTFTAQNRPVSVSTGKNFAPHVFKKEASAQGVSKRELERAMERLLKSERISNVPYGALSRGTHRLIKGSGA